ncbi:hypothetical protein [Halomonas litopenaei]|uniref:hypothetical protein n=1 Tax=Halomonas litopenaei TaxID=2109328 RepID=UPI000C5BF087|nr:hypothetical protein [Halomonas sp.]|tara:strand:+ start:1089 stop:1457 length:369 start_codon:yes stop_codon:yes gene_type:complete
MARAIASPARLSLMVGLMLVLALTLPRYQMAGLGTRETLGYIVLGVLALASLFQWRLLDGAGRSRFLRMLFTLLGCMVVGLVVMAIYSTLVDGMALGLAVLSQGATAGLLLHAVVLVFSKRD